MEVKASASKLTITFNNDESKASVVMFRGERLIGNVFGAYKESGQQVLPEERKLSKSETVYVMEAVTEYCKTGVPKVEFI